MKTYVIMVSRTFPARHPRAGEPTGFVRDIIARKKVHTIRGNYALWAGRIKEVQEGRARLSLRAWSGAPYRSRQHEFASLTASDGVGIQQLTDPRNAIWATIDGEKVNWCEVAANDGLSFPDFEAWFRDAGPAPMAVIHFTQFRY